MEEKIDDLQTGNKKKKEQRAEQNLKKINSIGKINCHGDMSRY